MPTGTFEWEAPLIELENRIAELRRFADEQHIDVSEELARLEMRGERLKQEIYSSLSAWQRVQVARHPKRPTTLDYIPHMFDGFMELHGDRTYRDDPAIVGGLAMLNGMPVTVIGSQKGRDTRENIRRNFGLPHPEGYKKALRLMKQAEKFGRPIISLIDVVGAYPGIEAEERGQGLVIAENIRQMSFLQVPIICVVTGEGGSGGALAIGVGDRMLMLEHAWYSVISPEMCAQILWKKTSDAPKAAEKLCLTAPDLTKLRVIDDVVEEPLGGAHRDMKETASRLKEAIVAHLQEVRATPRDQLVASRLERYRRMGNLKERQLVAVNGGKSKSQEQASPEPSAAVTASGTSGAPTSVPAGTPEVDESDDAERPKAVGGENAGRWD